MRGGGNALAKKTFADIIIGAGTVTDITQAKKP